MSDKKKFLQSIITAFKDGQIGRRDFLKVTAALGVSTAASNSLLAQQPINGDVGFSNPVEGFQMEPITKALLDHARALKIDTVWDRGSPCGYSKHGKGGIAGMCCFRCQMGPCTLGTGNGPDKGACGASKDIVATRELVRRIAGGAAAHVEHARAAALTLKKVADGTIDGYSISDVKKLNKIYKGLRRQDDGDDRLSDLDSDRGSGKKAIKRRARIVALKSLKDLNRNSTTPLWLEYKASKERYEKWKELGILPTGGKTEITEAQHRTTMGVDSDVMNLSTCALKLGLVDGYCGLNMATGLQDILFGTPKLVETKASLTVIDPNQINLIINGHEPILAEKILEAAEKYNSSYPSTSLNIIGMCCSGNEMLMRHGMPLAGSMVQQELAILTGAVEAMVVDVQCILPNITGVAENFHTKIISTNRQAHFTGAEHMEFEPENAEDVAQNIIDAAVNNYPFRDAEKIFVPDYEPKNIMAGFSSEQIVSALSSLNKNDPMKPLTDAIQSGAIKGIVAIVGCVMPQEEYGIGHVTLTETLIKNDILVVGTGCWGHVAGQYGFLTPDETYPGVGEGLKGVLRALAKANGLKALPPCWHMGSCVDNGRIEEVANAIADYLNVPVHELPLAASAPEFVTEKAVAIGTWAVNLGLFTHIGDQPYVKGSEVLVKILTQDVEALVQGKFYVESDPTLAMNSIMEHINAKRYALGLS